MEAYFSCHFLVKTVSFPQEYLLLSRICSLSMKMSIPISSPDIKRLTTTVSGRRPRICADTNCNYLLGKVCNNCWFEIGLCHRDEQKSMTPKSKWIDPWITTTLLHIGSCENLGGDLEMEDAGFVLCSRRLWRWLAGIQTITLKHQRQQRNYIGGATE